MAGPGDAARELRRRVDTAPDGLLELPRDEVVHELAPADLNGDDPAETARYAQALLRLHGVRVKPLLSDAGAVRTTLRIDRGLAVQGALVVAMAAFLLGVYGRLVYGLALGLAGAVGVALVSQRFDWVDGHAPRAIPRGRLLGASTAILPVVLVFLAVVLPLRHHYRDQSNAGAAAGLLQGARDSLAAGDVKTAQVRIAQADQADPGSPAIDDARADVTVAEVKALLNDQARKEGVFDEAERAFAAGDARRAIRLMSTIKGFRNADERLAAYREQLRKRSPHR